jgi:hypothetical protein
MDIYSILSSKPNNSHYLRRYFNFINSCLEKNKTPSPEVYTENHHICPKSKDLFPEYSNFIDNPWNSAVLTERQHFIAHWLLWKSYDWSGMTYAFKCMTDGQISSDQKRIHRKISSKAYTLLRTDHRIYNSILKKGMVTAKNILTGECFAVSVLEFHSNPNLVGASTGLTHFKSEITKQKMRKPKSKAHADKINKNNAIMHTTPFICCLINRKTYTVNSWTKHYKILYEPGYLEYLGKIASDKSKGVKKTDEHKKAIGKARILRFKIERVCCIKTKKEYTTQHFNGLLIKEEYHNLNGFDSGDVYCVVSHKKYNTRNLPSHIRT